MSHLTVIKTQFKDLSCLKNALIEMGYSDLKEQASVKDYYGNTTTAELVVYTSSGFNFGFRRNKEEYELIADFYEFEEDEHKFVNRIKQKYAYQVVKSESEQQGFTVADEEVQPDGTVKLVLQRWF